MEIKDFPKIQCPFVRESNSAGKYLVTPEINPGYEWVFEDEGVRAVDKLHGTNICVIVEDGHVKYIDNRTQRIVDDRYGLPIRLKGMAPRAYEGVIRCLEKEHLRGCFVEGRNYGELVGPKINGNLHGLDHHLFVPFSYLNEFCHWKSFVQGKYPKTFESMSEWFKDLPSLFTAKRSKTPGLAEGLIFLHPNGRRAKLRREMFEWYEDDK